MAQIGRARVFQLPCGAGQYADPRDLPATGHPTLAETALPAKSESPPALAAPQTLDPTLDSHPTHPASVSERPLRRHASEVRAVCGSAARTALCGGCRVTGIPTAIAKYRSS